MGNNRLNEVIDEWLFNSEHTLDFYTQIKDNLILIEYPTYRADLAPLNLQPGDYVSTSQLSFTKDFPQLRDFITKRIDLSYPSSGIQTINGDDNQTIYIFQCDSCIAFDVQSHLLNRDSSIFPDALDFYQEAEVILPDIIEVTSIEPILKSDIPHEWLLGLGLDIQYLSHLNLVNVEQHTQLEPVYSIKSPTYLKRLQLVEDFISQHGSFSSGSISSSCPFCNSELASLSSCIDSVSISYCPNSTCPQAYKPFNTEPLHSTFTDNQSISSDQQTPLQPKPTNQGILN